LFALKKIGIVFVFFAMLECFYDPFGWDVVSEHITAAAYEDKVSFPEVGLQFLFIKPDGLLVFESLHVAILAAMWADSLDGVPCVGYESVHISALWI
jgi:hypothetical protein